MVCDALITESRSSCSGRTAKVAAGPGGLGSTEVRMLLVDLPTLPSAPQRA